MTIIVSNEEEKRIVKHLIETVKTIYVYMEKNRPIEDIFAEAMELQTAIFEAPHLIENVTISVLNINEGKN